MDLRARLPGRLVGLRSLGMRRAPPPVTRGEDFALERVLERVLTGAKYVPVFAYRRRPSGAVAFDNYSCAVVTPT
jgi:hypothetical protein